MKCLLTCSLTYNWTNEWMSYITITRVWLLWKYSLHYTAHSMRSSGRKCESHMPFPIYSCHSCSLLYMRSENTGKKSFAIIFHLRIIWKAHTQRVTLLHIFHKEEECPHTGRELLQIAITSSSYRKGLEISLHMQENVCEWKFIYF